MSPSSRGSAAFGTSAHVHGLLKAPRSGVRQTLGARESTPPTKPSAHVLATMQVGADHFLGVGDMRLSGRRHDFTRYAVVMPVRGTGVAGGGGNESSAAAQPYIPRAVCAAFLYALATTPCDTDLRLASTPCAACEVSQGLQLWRGVVVQGSLLAEVTTCRPACQLPS